MTEQERVADLCERNVRYKYSLRRENDLKCGSAMASLALEESTAELKRLAARCDALEEAAKAALPSLVAALSILNRAHAEHKEPRLVVGSDKMFRQMLKDYEKDVARARTALGSDPA